MKNNLSAGRQRLAIIPTILLGFLSMFGLILFSGCAGSPPSPAEQFLFHVTTNEVPVVTNWTATVTATNPTTGAVVVSNVVNWATNIESHVNYTVSTNGAALLSSVSAVTGIVAPGWGQLAGVALFGILSAWGAIRSKQAKQMTAGATVLAQSVETLLAVIQTTPQGQQLTDKLKLELARNQNTAGVLSEIAHLVETTVDNDAAKKAAKLILDTLPQPAT